MKKPALLYISDQEPGIKRKKWGRGFSYFNPQGERIREREIIKRIKGLAIPPVWEEVWICPVDKGHLQATGRDDRGRKQYIYHDDWVAYRQAKKFYRLHEFASLLPEIRRVTLQHLQDKRWTRRKVLALIVRVLDETAIRIGNEQYKKRNETYGLTTLRRKHLDVKGDAITFSYQAKSGQYRDVPIENPLLTQLIKDCSELQGYEVFRYVDGGGPPSKVDSQEVNDYLHELTGADFSSKDFRTWAGTASAVEFYETARREVIGDSRKKLLPTLVRMVAKKLGNTEAICREYYIHPSVLEQVERRALPEIEAVRAQFGDPYLEYMENHELLTLHLLEETEAVY